ncbi:hypothetical protein [Porphyromonas macacae]|nr:hypothetical protein [Porphyromonas macacae]
MRMLHAAEDVSLPQQRYGQQDIWERDVFSGHNHRDGCPTVNPFRHMGFTKEIFYPNRVYDNQAT